VLQSLQVLVNSALTTAADVYAVGVLLWQVRRLI
jgi:hypothetical protein